MPGGENQGLQTMTAGILWRQTAAVVGTTRGKKRKAGKDTDDAEEDIMGPKLKRNKAVRNNDKGNAVLRAQQSPGTKASADITRTPPPSLQRSTRSLRRSTRLRKAHRIPGTPLRRLTCIADK